MDVRRLPVRICSFDRVANFQRALKSGGDPGLRLGDLIPMPSIARQISIGDWPRVGPR
jgi:hypothetical protein